jgi:hypothetical protein
MTPLSSKATSQILHVPDALGVSGSAVPASDEPPVSPLGIGPASPEEVRIFVASVDACELAGNVLPMDGGGLEKRHVEFFLLNLRAGGATGAGRETGGSDACGEQGAANQGREKVETA